MEDERKLFILNLVLGHCSDEKVLKDINETFEYESGEKSNITLDEINELWNEVQNIVIK